ncbi:MAG: peptidyl-tRNA hydrolase [Candidatus Woesearchaeota archaeon]|nr:MAG: peptidyl-tRNA hydrolase [Candidatus Woesearchaeota archaeon]
MLKQVILVRTDLKLPKGKLASQVAHASVEGVLSSKPSIVKNWRFAGMKKIILKVKNLEELLHFEKEAKKRGLTTALITDAGLTVVEPGTTTCLAIGPDIEEKIDELTGNLKIL